MPSRYPAELRRQVVDLARSGTRAAQLAETLRAGATSNAAEYVARRGATNAEQAAMTPRPLP
jgi:hypothetical protein